MPDPLDSDLPRAVITVPLGEHERRDEDWCYQWCVVNHWDPWRVVIDRGDGAARLDIARLVVTGQAQIVVCTDPAAVWGGGDLFPRLEIAPPMWSTRPRRPGHGRRVTRRPDAFR